MWELAGGVALSIFLTVALFFTVYSAAYFIVMGGFKLVRYIKNELVKDKD